MQFFTFRDLKAATVRCFAVIVVRCLVVQVGKAYIMIKIKICVVHRKGLWFEEHVSSIVFQNLQAMMMMNTCASELPTFKCSRTHHPNNDRSQDPKVPKHPSTDLNRTINITSLPANTYPPPHPTSPLSCLTKLYCLTCQPPCCCCTNSWTKPTYHY
ncbi:uncharacterized protein LY89DRAFT_381320 [Mollisia scopiformis]|uniref:Uncharacterized protein n=1 Tax=Mollisia scopiformis TaxID=149040 RepID=A0A194XNM3_MOLSC|nr:uncharacterized protein LY89DRAFT_381320 [Mollisia scopiformis]KUJ21709.1 hypothetical protein LY89DRAFT_381320 [Mollisia scopiformis]